MVHRDVLRSVASQIDQLATTLDGALNACIQGAAASTGGAAGGWDAAQHVNTAMRNAYHGITQYAAELKQAHGDTATRLRLSADHYDAAEQQITAAANAAGNPSATIVESGGNNVPLSPTPAQARLLAIMHHTGGGGPNWSGSYPITENAAFTAANAGGYTWQQVQQLLAGTDPGAITAAGAAYDQLQAALTAITQQLAGHGQTLAASWSGPTAVTAVSQLQQLHQTATDLQANTWAAKAALGWYGPVLAAFKASPPKPATGHPADQKAASQAAQQLMTALNGHAQTAYYQMPAVVNKNLPPPLAGTGGSGTSGGVSSGGASGGAYGGGSGGAYGGGGVHGVHGGGIPGLTTPGRVPGVPGGGVPGLTTPGGVPGVPGGGVPGGGVPGGGVPGTPGQVPAPTQLAGVNPGGVGTISPPAPAPAGPGGLGTPPGVGPGGLGTPPGVGPGGVGVLPPLPSTGGGGTSGRVGVAGEVPLPGGAAPGELGGIPGIGGTAPVGGLSALGETPTISPTGMITGQGVPATADAVPADGLAASGGAAAGDVAAGPGGMPMMGGVPGGAGQDGIGRARQSWTAEEEGTWDPAAADTAAGAGAPAGSGVGAMPAGAGPGRDRDQDRIRQAWMAEEDLWCAGQPVVPPVISQN